MIFLMKLCGSCIGYFVLRMLARQFFITTGWMTKIVSIFFLIQWFAFPFLANFFSIFLLNALLLSVVYVLIFVLQKRQESLFRYGFPEFLTSIILQMKIGKSFRSSFQFSLENLPTYQKEILSKIYQNVVFLPQANDKKMTFHRSFSGILLHELRKIDQSTHQTIDKIENFRTRLITANNFRRRSGRIRENIYVQLGFMSFIYVSAFAYIAWTMPVSLIGDILIVSLAFFLLGGTIALFIGRKIKWTI